MPTIYDKYKNNGNFDNSIDTYNSQNESEMDVKLSEGMDKGKKELSMEDVHTLVDDIILKNHVKHLKSCDVIPLNGSVIDIDSVRLFKVNKMVYSKDEYSTEKFNSVISSMSFSDCTLILVINGKGYETDFYLGVRVHDDEHDAVTVSNAFEASLKGEFPGVELEPVALKDFGHGDLLMQKVTDTRTISAVNVVPTNKSAETEYTNTNFIQGIEKYADSMRGREYVAIILAENTSNQVADLRNSYETIYTQLFSQVSQQLNYGTNSSTAITETLTRGFSDSSSITKTIGWSNTETNSKSHTEGKFTANTISSSVTTGVNAGVSFIASLGISESLSLGYARSWGNNKADTESESKSAGTNGSVAKGESHQENESKSNAESITNGQTQSITFNIKDKYLEEVLKRIDKQLERITIGESVGLWSIGAYFCSQDNSTAEIGATVFRSIMQGDESGIEASSINTWRGSINDDRKNVCLLNTYISNFIHPIFSYNKVESVSQSIVVSATSMLTSKEAAIVMGLPRHSVPGLPISEYIPFAKEVVNLGIKTNKQGSIAIGAIFDQNNDINGSSVCLDINSFCQHTLVTGSTGSGKSETVYQIIHKLLSQSNTKILIVEPAKGEYKNIFGNFRLLGTNPIKGEVLRINPFAFPKGMHVLDHIDRLIEIFGVCWPMYAAMPAVLREAMLLCYKQAGWNLSKSICRFGHQFFPTFIDLKKALTHVINYSEYSAEVKSNYKGSLLTRVNSLTNGLFADLFTPDEIGDDVLFGENCIIDLSNLGNQEARSLIMAIITMKLYEYRKYSDSEPNAKLNHITILEEAHNILPRCSHEQSEEGSNVKWKSVEMITNAIAEMRTYGEGFIIVDQAPGAVDISAIRNTNTKIIMRLPEMDDRKVAGKSAAMNDSQIDQIAKLPTGVAAIYQNDWEAPLLCHVSMFDGERIKYNEDANNQLKECQFFDTIRFLLHERIDSTFIIETVEKELQQLNISSASRKLIYKSLEEYQQFGEFKTLNNDNFPQIASIVSEILNVDDLVEQCVDDAVSISDLNEELSGIIPEQLNDIKLSISQCLMQIYAKTDERLHIYSEWFKEVCI